MIVTFVGHGDTFINRNLSDRIKDTIIRNVSATASIFFYCGGYGNFDTGCAMICKELKPFLPTSKTVYVSPYLTDSAQRKIKSLLESKIYDATVYPPLENVPPRFAISKRNEWMIDKSDLIIAFVSHTYGGAYKNLRYAVRKGKNIINLAT